MTNLSHVPQFGNWENQDNVPYTVFFDNVRKGRAGSQMVNPNDPEDTSSVLSDNPEMVKKPSHERARSREEVRMMQYPDPSPNHENMARINAWEFEQIVDRSALHRWAKVRDSASWEGNQSYESNQGAPAKTPMKPFNNSRSDDKLGSGADDFTKFGSWNNDPASTEAYKPTFEKTKKRRSTEFSLSQNIIRVPGEEIFPQHRSGWGMSYPTSAEEFHTLDCSFIERFDDEDDDKNDDDDVKVCCFWRSK